jgi:hypothetical protein
MVSLRHIASALTLLALLPSCKGGGSVAAPVVRVDLRPKLPQKVLRRLLAADTTYE